MRAAAGARAWSQLSYSADGTKLAASVQGGGVFYVSTDAGITWTSRTFPINGYWSIVKYSGDGSALFAWGRLRQPLFMLHMMMEYHGSH